MNFANTVKVSNIRAAAAYAKALEEFDAALPEFRTAVDQYIAEREAKYVELCNSLADRENKDRATVALHDRWCTYEVDVRTWKMRSWFSRAVAPVPPEHPKPHNDEVASANYRLGNLTRWGGSPPPVRVSDFGSTLSVRRTKLANLLSVARASIGPYRMTWDDAAFMADCESGEALLKFRAEFAHAIKLNRGS